MIHAMLGKDKSKVELINELQKLQQEYDSLKTSYIKDIIQRKQAEKTLILEKENFRHSLDDSPLGVRIATIEGDTIYANKTLLSFYGYESLEELQVTPLKNRYTPESYILSRKRKRQRERGDLSATKYEVSIVKKNGEIRNLQVFRKEVLWDGISQFQILYDDITAHKLAEEERLEKERELNVLFKSMINAFVVFNSVFDNAGNFVSYRFVFINDAYELITGVKNEEVKGKTIHDVWPETEPEWIRRYGKVAVTGVPQEFELYHSPTMKLYHCSVYRPGETKDRFCVIFEDITNRKKAEEELRKSKNLLEDLYKHLNEIRENERASISREIHDQLGQSMTVLKLDLNRMHKYIDTNPEAVTKLKSMIELVSDTIKDVQRISSDLRPGILDELGLVSAIEWYCDEFEKRTGIKCNLKLDNSDYPDPQINLIFFRVFQETLTNVIRHAKASSVSIKLNQLKKGATMTIQDNGIGIPAEMIVSSRSLGLISMRERVRQFNGTIDISSKKGNGTKLIIFIPSLSK